METAAEACADLAAGVAPMPVCEGGSTDLARPAQYLKERDPLRVVNGVANGAVCHRTFVGALPPAAMDDGWRRPALAGEPLAPAAEALRAMPPGESLRWRPLARQGCASRPSPPSAPVTGGNALRYPVTCSPVSYITGALGVGTTSWAARAHQRPRADHRPGPFGGISASSLPSRPTSTRLLRTKARGASWVKRQPFSALGSSKYQPLRPSVCGQGMAPYSHSSRTSS